jgi:hypothetical protein
MVELLIIRKKDPNLIVRVLKRKNDIWNAESYGSSEKDCSFEMVLKTKDANILADLFIDLQRLGYPIEKAISKYKELTSDPNLFFLH